jgi:class 3 adenylate cyclase
MRCSKCGRENRAGRRFCAHCGAKLTLVCASCKAENEPGEQFCGDCGQRIAAAEARPPPEPRSYTPKHLAEKILTSRSALEGERKQVTVLFADVKGSMELGEKVDPEEWYRIMDRFFQILSDGVHRFEGTVNQYTGDGIMALFGAPIAHEDHAQRTCCAALYLTEIT